MAELTLEFDCWDQKELKNYLSSLNGITNVAITDNDFLLIIDIKYDENIINWSTIKMEIDLFLEQTNFSRLFAFNKHSKNSTKEYKISRENICCEYCYRGAIEELYAIKGIEEVKGNVNKYYDAPNDKDIIITIKYNPLILSHENMQKIDESLDL